MATDLLFESEEDYVGLIREALEERYSKPRTGQHVTDVILCPRQRVFKEIDPMPITDRELNLYCSGKAVHEAIQWLFMSNRGRFEKEKYVEYENVEGSVDLYDKKRNTPLELKTSRSSNVDKPKSFHVEQLKYYMAMLNTSVGYVLYQCLMHFGDRPFRIFKISMTEQERKDQLTKLVKEMKSLETAKKAHDPLLARHVYFEKEFQWLCNECPYRYRCKKLNIVAQQTKVIKAKHTAHDEVIG